jgi:hypothetical protein
MAVEEEVLAHLKAHLSRAQREFWDAQLMAHEQAVVEEVARQLAALGQRDLSALEYWPAVPGSGTRRLRRQTSQLRHYLERQGLA